MGSLVDKSMPLHDYMDKRDIRRQGRFTVLAVAAAKMAIAEGGLDIKNVDNDKFGVIIGSGIGGVEVFFVLCVSYMLYWRHTTLDPSLIV